MRCLVLGGTGFIGSHVVDGLITKGHFVRIISRQSFNSKVDEKIEYVNADFGDADAIYAALDGIDLVIHLISGTKPASAALSPIFDVQTNLINSIILFDLMIKRNIKRIIFFSSGGTVYGEPNYLPINELHETDPICEYGITKLAIEKHLLMHHKLQRLEPIILRLSNPYGPSQSSCGVQGAISTFFNFIKHNKTIKIWGDGSIVRDYIYISDVVSALNASLDTSYCGVINIGSCEGISLLNIIKIIEEKLGQKAIIEFVDNRGFDVKTVVLDNSRAKHILGWNSLVNIDEGIKFYIDLGRN